MKALCSSRCLDSDASLLIIEDTYMAALQLSREKKCVQERGRLGWYIGDTVYTLQYNERKRHLLTGKHSTGNSWALVTYVCVGPLICPWAGERDKFMAPLVDHKTANCRGGKETRRSVIKRELERELQRRKYTEGSRKQKVIKKEMAET